MVLYTKCLLKCKQVRKQNGLKFDLDKTVWFFFIFFSVHFYLSELNTDSETRYTFVLFCHEGEGEKRIKIKGTTKPYHGKLILIDYLEKMLSENQKIDLYTYIYRYIQNTRAKKKKKKR